MTTHTWSPDRVGEQQIRILDEEGVDLSRVYIGHSNDDTDVDYLVGMLKQGVWLGLDRFPGGRPPYGAPNWEQRTEIVVRLIEAGYVDRIMLSHDYMVPLNHPADVREDRRQLNPDGYCFITRYVLPRLKKLGISDEHIRTMMVGQSPSLFRGRLVVRTWASHACAPITIGRPRRRCHRPQDDGFAATDIFPSVWDTALKGDAVSLLQHVLIVSDPHADSSFKNETTLLVTVMGVGVRTRGATGIDFRQDELHVPRKRGGQEEFGHTPFREEDLPTLLLSHHAIVRLGLHRRRR